MEGVELSHLFKTYEGKRVFITGDTGFKGSWMAYWLLKLGAEVNGYSLPPNTSPSHFHLLKSSYKTTYCDIKDLDSLKKAINEFKPEIIFHLAAQSLVRQSYIDPIETYQTNIMGTAHVLEASRDSDNLKSIVIVTTDKCYENNEQESGYIETDRMGGFDPYSSSKGCAELIVHAYRNSFFNISDFNKSHNTLIATARAGNVVGGGDWSQDRLIPDIVRSAVKNETTIIRYPNATRPWQHVLEPISGYLLLGQKLLDGKAKFSGAWNFGPEEDEVLSVKDVISLAKVAWNDINYVVDTSNTHWHEANLLSLNIDKAKDSLGWFPKWNSQTAISKAIQWYKEFYENRVVSTEKDLEKFIQDQV